MEIKETKDIDNFVEFHHSISKNYNKWVTDLKKNNIFLLSDKHPFWRNAEKKLFLAYDNNNIVGRVAGIINHTYNRFHNEKTAFFGFFDCINNENLARMLLNEVEKWAESNNMEKIIGPANPSSNYTWGTLIENFDEPNVIMMPYNPEYYPILIEKSGYLKEKDLYAFKWTYDDKVLEKFNSIYLKIANENKDIVIDFANIDDLESIFNDVKEVYNKAWEKNWGFVPMSDDEIRQMARELKPFLKKEYILFARINSKPIAFSLMLPDFNIVLKDINEGCIINYLKAFYKYFFSIDHGRMLTLGVNSDYRGRGIEILMILKAIETAKKLGWKWGDLSWTLEDNIKINKIIEKFGGKIYRKYRIYSKKLRDLL